MIYDYCVGVLQDARRALFLELETVVNLKFLVSKETVVLRRWKSETKIWFY